MMSGVVAAGRRVVTFDGPAASGKSTVAACVARRLGVPFVSSGLLYRAATLVALRAGADPHDASAVLGAVGRVDVQLRPGVEANRVLVDGADVTAELHTDAVDDSVSTVAAHPELRGWVDARLRELPDPFVVDGRDMGTQVFPDALRKFYLTASPRVRAARRVGERPGRLEEVARALERRDALDARQLRPAEDAVRVDTEGLDVAGVVAEVGRHLEGVRLR